MVVVERGQVVGPLIGQDEHNNHTGHFVEAAEDVPDYVTTHRRRRRTRFALLEKKFPFVADETKKRAPKKRQCLVYIGVRTYMVYN